MRLRILTAVLAVLLIVTGCSREVKIPEENKVEVKTEQNKNEDIKKEEIGNISQEEKSIDYNKIEANEAGKIMILMYHGVGDTESEWVRTRENFRKDLDILYQKGYRTISLNDYINNNINTPAGYTPVVITFDDGLKNQFNYIENNGKYEIDGKCAVSIMMDFAKDKPEFGNKATFYVYYPVPFRQRELIKDKYEYLVKNGFDIGNHSYTHEMLGKMDAEGIQKQIALNIKATAEYLPGYNVNSLALPYGSRPKDETLRGLIAAGEYEGTKYKNDAVLLVGSNPAPAPNNSDFTPQALPRVRASEMNTSGTGMYDWLKHFDTHPEERYISDGNPKTIALPKDNKEKVNLDSVKDKELILY
ncbi:polysaccharide deacetylase [Oxobacter pfennigii]|uniref:Polysaccharide deacetylase n=1 Tax=Oxobacter pfennigii TaxID=36849 RepID=A0A0P8W3Q6_9CLOT|nr:polysaccharide deacetylase family protein [Oxobacter pfennigii]KPU42215.1 polysaccharide deacetylase [Oxobacter pfennigii]